MNQILTGYTLITVVLQPPLIYGEFDTNRIGINKNDPSHTLHVGGDIGTTGSFHGNGAQLTSLNAANLTSGMVNNVLLDTDLQDLADGSLTATKVEHGAFFIDSPGSDGQVWKSDGDEKGYWASDNNIDDFITFIGIEAGHTNPNAINNTLVGYQTGYHNSTGFSNNMVGEQAGFENTTGKENNFVGHQAGYNNEKGSKNNFVGYRAGYANTNGWFNNFVGTAAGSNNNNGNYNNFFGYGAGYANEGSNNNFIGHFTGMNNTGDHNIFVGDSIAQSNTGNDNVIIGDHAALSKTAGNANTYLGGYAGYENASGDGNVFIGYGAGYQEMGSNKLYIENGSSINNLTDPLIYGDFATQQLGIGTKNLQVGYTLIVNGNALASGGFWAPSDERFKINKKGIEKAMALVNELDGFTYEYKEESIGGRKFDAGKQYGFIAQNVKEVLPELVKEGEDGYMAVRYAGVIPVLVEALKEQNSAVQVLQTENATMTATIENLTKKMAVLEESFAARSGSDASESVDVLNTEAILHQNVPNPFTTSTVIQYELPETVHTAQIIVYDLQGHQLKTFEDLKAGQGRVEIAGSTLKAGMYVYALLADGNVIGTKRMILTK